MHRSGTKSWIAIASVAFLGWMAGPVPAASSAGADEAAIRGQTVSWGKAYNGGDAKGVAAQYAEDAQLFPPGVAGIKGRAAILDYFTKDIASSKSADAVFVLNPKTDVGVSGTTGWESGTYQVTVKGAVVQTGKFLSVSRKKNGKWLYIRDIWNADAPPAVPATSAAPPPAPATKN